MDDRRTSTQPPTSLYLLTGVVVVFGLVALVSASLPTDLLLGMADRTGHADDVTPERIIRLRLIGVGLGIAHGFLASFLLTWGRAGASRFLDELQRQIGSTSPLAMLRRARDGVNHAGWLHIAALVIVIATAVGLRLKFLDVPMDYDEAYSFLNYARRPLYQGLADYNSTNNHLLNTAFMHVAYRVFGPREWPLRLHVLVAGIGVVAATYALGRRLHSRETGLVAAAIVATSYMMINYSVNARGYTWSAWMTVLLVHTFWRIAHAELRPRAVDWFAAGFVFVVGVLAIPTMVYSVAGCVGWLSIRAIRMDSPPSSTFFGLVVWSVLVGLAAVWLYAPAFVFRGVSAWQHPFVAPQYFSDWVSRVPAAWLYALKSATEGPAHWLVTASFVGVGLVVLALLKRREFSLLVAVPIATLVLMAVQRVTPPPRIFSFLAPLVALVAAGGLVATIQLICLPHQPAAADRSARQVNTVCCILAIALCAWSYSVGRRHLLPGGLRPTFLVEDVAELSLERAGDPTSTSNDQYWRLGVPEAVAMIESYLRPNDRVLVGLPADLPFHFYAARRGWTTPIGGQPIPAERLFLVIRSGEDPRVALRKNLSLGFTDPWILDAKWQSMAIGDLAIWLAHPASGATTESGSR
jgi:hypothetical protein